MDAKDFYQDRWNADDHTGGAPTHQRDWFHRFVLDPIFDPTANPRTDVTLALLEGGERVLDIGCYDGGFLERIQQAGLYLELCGVDIVADGVEAARQKGIRAEVVDLNSEALPFPEEHFDGVTMLAVLEHVFDPYSTLQEIHRVLRPGGELVIDVPNVGSLTNRARILGGRVPVTSQDAGWDGGHLHYFTKHALDQLLEGEGFEVVSRKTTGGHTKLREWWLSLLGGELVYRCRRI